MIQVEGLTKDYGRIRAVENLTFHVEKGEILGFLGPNGAGKSTTMRILTGFMPPSAGCCRIGGQDVFEKAREVKRRIGYLPENVPLYPEFTAREYLRFVARLKGMPARGVEEAVNRIVEKCGLESVRDRLIHKYSKGFRQRLGIAQALIHTPDVIILDEPTIGLDPAQIREVRELIRSLGREHTIILSSHILPEVSQVCDRVLIIKKGRIVAEDTPENLTRSVAGFGTCQFLARGQMESVQAVLEGDPILDGVELSADGDGLLRGTLSLGEEDRRGAILRTLVERGVEILEFSTRKASLEDVFLELTTEEAASGIPSGEEAPAVNREGEAVRHPEEEAASGEPGEEA